MQILISDCSRAALDGNPTQPFLVINLMGSYFLLAKAPFMKQVEKIMIFRTELNQFYSTFSRHVNLAYSSKLSELVGSMDIARKPALQHEWIMLYQIHEFVEVRTNAYRIAPPPYGAEVVVRLKNGKTESSIISNLFRLHGETFYFLSCPSSHVGELAIITDRSDQIIYGITYFVNEVVICLPFQSICSEKPCMMNLSPQIETSLAKTCYVRCGASYCTGFMISNCRIISARHLLASENHQVGIEVGVRTYPYNEERRGFVSRIGRDSVDIIQITIEAFQVSKNHVAMVEQTPQGKLRKQRKENKGLFGKEIVALGFGKYEFSPQIFSRIDMVMPTVEYGIVSKVIKIGCSDVFIKTDASLYNGFSGCGIWRQSELIGMAVFILKNKKSNSNYNKHNFSYTSDFILRLLKQDQNKQMVSPINPDLSLFDKIQTRFHLPLLPKL